MEHQYANEVVGFNARMTDIHAAIGRVQLTKVGGWTEAARQRRVPRRAPRGRRGPAGRRRTPPTSTTSTRSGSPAGSGTGVVAALREEHQVGCGVYYPIPNHQLESLRQFAPDLDLPVTEQARRRGDLASRCTPR